MNNNNFDNKIVNEEIEQNSEEVSRGEIFFDTNIGTDTKEIKYNKRNILFEKSDFIKIKDKILMSSPFVYSEKALENLSKCSNNFKFSDENELYQTNIYSIEEFGYVFNGYPIHFGSIIRNEQLTKREKIKITKKFLKLSKKKFYRFYEEAEQRLEKEEQKEQKVIRKPNVLFRIIYIIMCLVSLFYLLLLKKVFTWEWCINHLTKILEKDELYFNILTIGFFILLCCVLFIDIIDWLCGLRYYYSKDRYLKKQDKIFKKINKTFIIEYKYVWRYYLSNIRKNRIDYEPVGPYKLWEIDNSFFNKNSLVNELEYNLVRYKKTHKILYRIYITLYLISFIIGALLIKFVINT